MEIVSSSLISAFLQLSQDAVFVTDLKGLILQFNKIASNLLLMSSLNTKSLGCFISDSNKEEFHTILIQMSQFTWFSRKWTENTMSIIRNDGVEKKGHFGFRPVTLEDNSTVVIIFIRDTTEKHILETSFNGLIQALPDGMILADSQGKMVIINREAENLLGYTCHELTGKEVEMLVPPQLKDRHFELRHHYFKSPITSDPHRRNVVALRKNGQEIPLETHLRRIFVNSEPYVLVFFRDITAQIISEKEIIEARNLAEKTRNLKTDFLVSMNHEIRTPLTGIIGIVELLRNTSLDPEQKSFVHSLRKCGESLMVILNDVLEKPTSGEDTELNEVTGDLSTFTSELQPLFSAMLTHKEGVTLRFETELNDLKPPVYVKADFGKLRQILTNLTQNAIKFTDSGFITIRAEVFHGEGSTTYSQHFFNGNDTPEQLYGFYKVKFTVTDTGSGISSGLKQQLFTKFSQDETLPKKYPGSGLGLSITKRLVEVMKGEIGYVSELGKGSQFWTHFNMKASIRRTTANSSESLSSFSMGTITSQAEGVSEVLIVEDNIINSRVIRKLVEKLGFITTTATNGKEAVVLAEKSSFSLILMDIQMPVMDGYEATMKIRSKGIHTPIIALTAKVFSKDVEKCLEAGMDDHISKPVTLKALKNKINLWVLSSSAQRCN